MDVFKLLSRSAKPTPASRSTQKLPSSGAVANPQLFGHDEKPEQQQPTIGSKSSKKRKRGQNAAVEEEAAPALPAELDFFSAPAEKKNKKSKKGSKGDGEGQTTGNAAAQENGVGEGADTETGPYDEDECKRILRLHKLKIVVLDDYAPTLVEPTPDTTEKKKSKKKRKLEEDAAKAKEKHDKKHKKQLWPRPLTSFAELRTRYGISRRLAMNIEEQGYKMPTEVQLGTLPLLLGEKGKGVKTEDASGAYLNGDIDLLTVAPTGSGKTIAFTIPIINDLLTQAHKSTSKPGIQSIILAPTRELASQIVNEARKLAKGTGIKAALMKKGMEVVERPEEDDDEEDEDAEASADEENADTDASDSESDGGIKFAQPKRKRRKAEITKAAILVATPLALLNALKRKDGSVSQLPSVHYLVLDEADVLLDPLFREQTLAVWNACSNPLLRVGLWSATMGSNIESLAIDTLNTRWTSLSPTPSVPRPTLVRAVVGLKDTAIPNISHKLIYAATEQGKLLGLRQLLHPTATPSSDTSPSLRPPFLVFTQTIPRAIALHSELLYDIPPEAGGSSRIAVLHANLSSAARSDVMTRFRKGEVWVLITTDLLARGVDFRGLNGVVNYDVPNSAAAYVHRVGRTGRAGREGGVAVTFYTQEDIPYIKNVANVIRASEKLRDEGAGGVGGEGEVTVKQWLLDALPTPSKRDKQMLKKRGVEARRTVKGKDEEGRTKARISTKSGYERRKENNLRGAKMARREGGGGARERGRERKTVGSGGEIEFEGFEE